MPQSPSEISISVARLRHDLIKHLDIPRPGANMSRAAWEVLQRRIFNPHAGMVSLGQEWIIRLRRPWRDHPGLLEGLTQLSAVLRKITALQPEIEACAKSKTPPSEALVLNLKEVAAVIQRFEAAARTLDPKVDNDPDAALDWLLSPQAPPVSPSPASKKPARGKRKRPSGPSKTDSKATPCRVLVVDDRLTAIERFQSMEHMRERFDWVRLCELDGPCWSCPHRDGCGLKRARIFREVEGALRRAQANGRPVDVLLMDVHFDDIAASELLPPPPGFEPNTPGTARALQGPLMVRALRNRTDLPSVPVVLMTARRSLPPGAEKLLEGLDGLHFVDDEASIEALTVRLDTIARRRHRSLTEGAFFWGRSTAMQAVREQIELLAQGPRPVLLTGPSGTGKSFLVEEVILPMSKRSHLVTIDLSAFPETLVESELFGHVKGAFSGALSDRPGLIEEAAGGVLFIDEIGHLSAATQRKLLLFLQDRHVRRVGASHRTRRKVDVKVIAATHMDLSAEVEAGRFRFDLFMRLRPATQVTLPPLRERSEDLEGMMRHLVQRLSEDLDLAHLVQSVADARGRTPNIKLQHSLQSKVETEEDTGLRLRLPEPTLTALRAYPWPGNTRELESVMDTLLLRALADATHFSSQSPIIEVDHYLALKLLGMGRARASTGRPTLTITIEPAADLKQMRQRLERGYLIEAFRTVGGDMERMSELILGSDHPDDRHRLTVRMNQLGLKVTELKISTAPAHND